MALWTYDFNFEFEAVISLLGQECLILTTAGYQWRREYGQTQIGNFDWSERKPLGKR